MKKISILLLSGLVLTSCVSKKKYIALEQENGQIKSELTKTRVAKEDLEAKFEVIQARVDQYNKKINSLTDLNAELNEENDAKLETVANVAVISTDTKEKMRATLNNVDPALLAEAKTLKDSMDLAVSYSLSKSIDTSDLEEEENSCIFHKSMLLLSLHEKESQRFGHL